VSVWLAAPDIFLRRDNPSEAVEIAARSKPCRGFPVENHSLVQRLIARPEFGPFVLLIVEIGVFWGFNHDFLSPQNISNTLAFTVELGLIALAMTLLMTSGEFDLSVGSLFGFSPVLMWTLFNSGLTSLEVGFVAARCVMSIFVRSGFHTKMLTAR